MPPELVHLHVHSEYSMLDGAIRIDPLVAHVQAAGMSAVALTDHGNMFGALAFHRACERHGVAPILGCEVALTPGARGDREDPRAHHLVLLAASQQGYRNLVRLVSLGWVDGYAAAGAPRIDLDLLRTHSAGLVGLSACMGGHVAQQVLHRGADAGREALGTLRDAFEPGQLFVELQDHGFPEDRPLNRVLVELARALELPLVATNDCHYLVRQDARSQLALQCIGAGRSLAEMETTHHGSSEMYLKSAEQMAALFKDLPQALSNTLRVAEMCGGQVQPLAQPKLPSFVVPGEQSEPAYLRMLAEAGLVRRIADLRRLGHAIDEAAYRERLAGELGVIVEMGFAGYFLIVQDFINWAKDHGIPVGPGRGSGAGSLVAYALGITDLDPIPYGLLFERFLNPERVSMPDFDVDFCMDQRDRVIDYVRDKYGHHSVGQIATFHQLKSRSVVRDVGRVLGMAPSEAGRLATMIPEPVGGKTVSIADALGAEKNLRVEHETNPAAREVLDTAQALENLTRHAGMHAAGVVISEGPLWDHVPVFCPEPDVFVTQYDKNDVEAAGLVKFDFLGLRTLTVIDIATRLIAKRPDRGDAPFDLGAIPLDDPATYTLLCSGQTTNVFQLESSGMQELFKQLRPDCFEDIIAAVALYRPGPMGAGMDKDFVERRHGRQRVSYTAPVLEPILRETRGVIVYQEQVMHIAQAMAGYSLGGADLLRRAMGKKKASEMAKQKAVFLEGAVGRGHSKQVAEEVFEQMAYFAGYGFNKSHSAAYALITYQTAYLKAHFPVELACATLSADKDKIDKVVRTVAEARTQGITVLPPDVNESETDFTVVYDSESAGGDDASAPAGRADRPVSWKGRISDPLGPKIRFGLGALKGVGSAALEALFEARRVSAVDAPGAGAAADAPREHPFEDVFDFCARVDLRRVNKAVVEALVQSGAFDSAHAAPGVHRAQGFAAIEPAIERGKRMSAERSSGQTSLFGLLGDDARAAEPSRPNASYPSAEPWDSRELLAREKGTLGFYVSGHPLDRYERDLRRFCNATTTTVRELEAFQTVTLGGSVEGYRERRTKSGQTMAFFHLEDAEGRVEVIVRPRPLERAEVRAALTSGEPVLLTGKVKHERDRGADESAQAEAKILLDDVSSLAKALNERTHAVHVTLPVEALDRERLETLRATLERFRGDCPVSLTLLDPGRWRAELLDTGITVEPSDALMAGLERAFGRNTCEWRT